MTDLALLIFGALIGGFFAWSVFRLELRTSTETLEDYVAELDALTDDRDEWKRRAVDAERVLTITLRENVRLYTGRPDATTDTASAGGAA